MFDALREFFDDLISDGQGSQSTSSRSLDPKMCAAVLMVQVMVADGTVRPEEQQKLQEVLETHYDLTPEQAQSLAKMTSPTQYPKYPDPRIRPPVVHRDHHLR